MSQTTRLRLALISSFILCSLFIYLTSVIFIGHVFFEEFNSSIQESLTQETRLALYRTRRFLDSSTNTLASLSKVELFQNPKSDLAATNELLNLAQRMSTDILYILLTDSTGRIIASSNPNINQFLTPTYFTNSNWFQKLQSVPEGTFVYQIDPKPNFKLSPAVFPKETFWTFSISTKIPSSSAGSTAIIHILYDWENLVDTRLLATSRYVFLFNRQSGLIGSTYDLAKLFYTPETAPPDYMPPQVLTNLDESEIKVTQERFLGSREKYYLATGRLDKKNQEEPDWYVVSIQSPELVLSLKSKLIATALVSSVFLILVSIFLGLFFSSRILNQSISLSNLAKIRAQRLEKITNNLEGLIIIITNLDAIITSLNHYAEKFFHQSKHELIGSPLEILIDKTNKADIKILTLEAQSVRIINTGITLNSKFSRRLSTSLTLFNIPTENNQTELVWIFQDSTIKDQYEKLLFEFERQFF